MEEPGREGGLSEAEVTTMNHTPEGVGSYLANKG